MNFALIICTYQRPQPLLNLLKSVREQSFYPNDIIIVDGSADKNTEEILDANSFDRVILSRTVDQLDDPEWILSKSLEVGKKVAVGFVNNAYYENRWNAFFKGTKIMNDLYPNPWYRSSPSNPFSIREFEDFCHHKNIKIHQRICYAGDWEKKQHFFSNLLSGYAIYDLSLNNK